MKWKIARALQKLRYQVGMFGVTTTLLLSSPHKLEPQLEGDPQNSPVHIPLDSKYDALMEESIQLFNPHNREYLRNVPLFERLDDLGDHCPTAVAVKKPRPYLHINFCPDGIEEYLDKGDLDTPTHEYLHVMGDYYEVEYHHFHNYVERWLNDSDFGEPSYDADLGNTMKQQIRKRLYKKDPETGTYTYKKEKPGTEDFAEIMAYALAPRDKVERQRRLQELPEQILVHYRMIIDDNILNMWYDEPYKN